MLEFIGGIVIMALAIFVFSKVRGSIVTRAVKTVLPTASIGKKYRINSKGEREEVFEASKFWKSIFNIFDLKLWAKSFTFFIRHMLIISVIAGAVYGYGWFKGRGDKPLETNIAYDKEWRLNLVDHGEYIYKPKYSNELQLRDLRTDKIKKIFKGKDLGALQEKLKPVAFQMRPIGVLGYGISSLDPSFEAGAGLSFLRYWKWNLDGFLTNKGAYVGTSYSITDNSALGAGVGRGWSGDNRLLMYYRWCF